MSDALIDDLLDERVPRVEQLPDWPGVLRRARRTRRRRALAAALVAALVVVPAAFAVRGGVLDWFHGKPAPASIKQQFVRFNAELKRFAAEQAKRGFERRAPSAIAARAHGVVAVRSGGTSIYLWAAPRRGGGACTLLQSLQADGTPGIGSSTSCDETWPPAQALWFGTAGGAALPAGELVYGRAFRGATAVVVELPSGARPRLPVVESFFVGFIPKHTHPVQVESYRANGKRLALVTSAGGTAPLPAAERRELAHSSAAGTPFPLPVGDPRTKRLVRGGYDRTAVLLASRGGRRYFRLPKSGPHDCYAVGRTGRSWPLGTIACRTEAPYFPSAELPIVDLSTLDAAVKDGRPRFLHVGGVAADGVARVVVMDREGRGLLWLPVRGNVYDSGSAVLPRGAVQLKAQDRRGWVLARVPR